MTYHALTSLSFAAADKKYEFSMDARSSVLEGICNILNTSVAWPVNLWKTSCSSNLYWRASRISYL